ncbi:Tromp-1 [Anaerococcus prevotii]|uniref:Periplasmic solute binding protein n=1 Tax=Anaerococcus prevotii (strain ATCC 9321 / DSM 20548 / JCM 6508 / NCTC 11806 / PC1) TaxID=525919 RepID=C7RGX4_ANAPD|nr:zinc ABC transporter substrate-binding protein [Anaerococcus prevotii]ACV28735.1 periplasmic solute binding protein [Anaerococcus prevotii DSM 20548]MDU3137593.1 zinc ABC transporter substrate-binding protein [Anaerococcus prevotii]SUU94407.1 Tromp-1 [Anaerococcus prevotii]
MKLKKLLIVLAMLIIASSCSKNADKTHLEANKQGDGKKIVTVTTSFLYDMVDNLVGDKVEKEFIIPAGEDPHLYTAKPQDLEKIKKADLLLYHGLHFEGKMVDVLEKKGSAVSRTFKKEDIGEMEEDGKVVVDPHFWFDIKLYKEATKNAAEDLEKLLPEEKESIEKNLESYLAKLDELDKENKEKISSIPEASRYLITPHDAFNYFSRAYNIPVKAPQGVSTDSEVANKDIEDTVNFIVKNKVKAIFAESTTDPMRMEKLKEAVKAKGFDVKVVSGEGQELFSDSLASEGQVGDNYIDMYKHNVDLIVENLK